MNTNAKGSAWRHKVDTWLRAAGFRTTVRGIGFAGDDVHATQPENCTGMGRPGLRFSVEAKNHRDINLASFVDQAVAQADEYDDGELPVVVVHRRGKASVDESYVVMPGWAWIELVTR